MEMPKPGAAHAKLDRFLGRWEGTEIMHPSPWDPEGGEAMGRFSYKSLDGFFIISDYEQSRGDEVTFRGHGVYGFATDVERYTMYWFDSVGTDQGERILGAWEGNVLTFQNQSPRGHHRYVYEHSGGDTFAFRLEFSQDGADWKCLMDGRYRRIN